MNGNVEDAYEEIESDYGHTDCIGHEQIRPQNRVCLEDFTELEFACNSNPH